MLQEMFPGLKALDKLTPEQLQEVLDAAGSARSTTQHHWERHADTMLTDLDAEVADALGVEKLTPTQSKRLRSAYREEAIAAAAAREAGGEAKGDFLDRHEKGDKSLLKEFAEAFLKDWMEPAKRQVTAGVVRRSRPVPNGQRTSAVVTKMPEIDYNNEDAFKKALSEARAANG